MNVQLLMEAVETQAMTASEKGYIPFLGHFFICRKKRNKNPKGGVI